MKRLSAVLREIIHCCPRWKGIRASFAKLSLISFCVTTVTLLFAGNDTQLQRRPPLHLQLISAPLDSEEGGGGIDREPQPVFNLEARRVPNPISLTRRLPQALIIGVPFGGTRALQEWMSVSPLFVAPKDPISFFADDTLFRRGFQWYIDQMPPTWPNQTTVERFAPYFVNPEAPKRVVQTNPNMKLLLITRDPTKRLVSDYTHSFNRHLKRRKGNATYPSFEQMVFKPGTTVVNDEWAAVDRSLYHKHLVRWLKEFPRNQIHVVDGDLFQRDPAVALKGVEKFLGLKNIINRTFYVYDANRGYFCRKFTNRTTKCLKDRRKLTIPLIKNDTLPVVQEYFRDANKKFFDAIQQWLPYWS